MRSGFTLIELLIVIAIIAILSVVVVLALNPAEMLRESRDNNRVSDMDNPVAGALPLPDGPIHDGRDRFVRHPRYRLRLRSGPDAYGDRNLGLLLP
jgi:prepilin-type N-terminal cleavage/methylation domain-containing protein